MPFTILDNDESLASNPQSIWMQTDINALVAGIGGDGVVSDCTVTAQGSPDMTVAVASGTVRIAGAQVAVTAGNVTITAADGTNPRIDLIVVSNAGTKSATAGTAAANPKAPDIPANSVLLAMVYVPASDTTIAANQITDKRVIVTLIGAGAANQVAVFSAPDTLFSSAGLLYDDTSKRLSVVNGAGTAELRLDGADDAQALFTLYAGGVGKWEFFRQPTSYDFGIYDATNSVISLSINPTTKRFQLHAVASLGYVLDLQATGFATWTGLFSNTNSTADAWLYNTKSTGTPDPGFGMTMAIQLQSSTTEGQAASDWTTLWATATDASRKARVIGTVYDTAAREWIRGEASGSAPMIGFLGASAVVRQSIGAAAPAGGTGATAGAYDTAANRNAMITLVNNMRTALLNLGLAV